MVPIGAAEGRQNARFIVHYQQGRHESKVSVWSKEFEQEETERQEWDFSPFSLLPTVEMKLQHFLSGQSEGELRAAFGSIVSSDNAAVIFDQPLADAEPQSQSGFPAADKRLEESSAHPWLDAGA